MNEDIHIKGNIFIDHIRDGVVIGKMEIHNITTNVGKAALAGLLNGVGSVPTFTYVAIGTGTTAEAATDTALEAEISSGGGSRAAGTCTLVTTTVTNDTAQVSKLFTFSSSFSVSETAVFNASSGVTMINRKTFTAIPVVSGDQLQIIHQFKIS